jgi:lactoylglutathione lyase
MDLVGDAIGFFTPAQWTSLPRRAICLTSGAIGKPGPARIPAEDGMKYRHTMVRVRDLDESLEFYCGKMGLVETRRVDRPEHGYTLIFLATPADADRARAEKVGELELTFNHAPETYTGGRNFGHLAYEVDDIYATCEKLMKAGVTINRPPRDGRMAFVRSPDNISIEILQKGEAKAPAEPWASMPNTGVW